MKKLLLPRSRKSYCLTPAEPDLVRLSQCRSSLRDKAPTTYKHNTLPGLGSRVQLQKYGKSVLQNDSWVTVHKLQSMADGGILDGDDQLLTVVDDKDQILAIYDEQDTSVAPAAVFANGTSNASSSSVEWNGIRHGSGRSQAHPSAPHSLPPNHLTSPGSRSAVYSAKPVFVRADEPRLASRLSDVAGSQGSGHHTSKDNSVEITSLDLPPSNGLLVVGRAKGSNVSDPSTSPVSVLVTNEGSFGTPHSSSLTVRQAALPVHSSNSNSSVSNLAKTFGGQQHSSQIYYQAHSQQSENKQSASALPTAPPSYKKRHAPPPPSLQENDKGLSSPPPPPVPPPPPPSDDPNGVVVEAEVSGDAGPPAPPPQTEAVLEAKKEQAKIRTGRTASPSSVPSRFLRSGGNRQSSVADKWLLAAEAAEQRHRQVAADEDLSKPSESVITIVSSGKPLAMQVAPDYDQRNRLKSVVITQIHDNGSVYEDGRLYTGDKIIEINNRPVYQMSYVRAQSYLQERTDSITLKVIDGPDKDDKTKDNHESVDSSTDKKLLSPSAQSASHIQHNTTEVKSALQKANTKKIGDTKMEIVLTKGSAGLGFTVTSRDTAVDGDRPFYIKTVLPRGAAFEDGRLVAGDRLLEVNGKSLKGMVQRDVVALLRQVKEGDSIALVIARHGGTTCDSSLSTTSPAPAPVPAPAPPSETPPATPPTAPVKAEVVANALPSPALPRHLPADRAATDWLGSERNKQRVSYDVELNCTGSAGLGVSVKGRTEPDPATGGHKDLGIYIKKIMCGGAAFKDGRLQQNDQLIGINEANLLGCSNSQAMNLISHTMQSLDPGAKRITLTVYRVSPHSSTAQHTGSVNNEDRYHHQPDSSAQLKAANRPGVSPDTSLYLDIDQCRAIANGGAPFPGPVSRTSSSHSHPPPAHSKHYTIPGYGDYALVVKSPTTVSAASRIENDTAPMIIDDEQNSFERHSRPSRPLTDGCLYEDMDALSGAETETSSVRSDAAARADAFDREAPGRRSMSEKRHGGGKADPSQLHTYQRIKHHRQTSAPSIHDCVVTSSPVALRDKTKMWNAYSDLPDVAGKRRSMSLESLSKVGKAPSPHKPMIHELAMQKVEAGGTARPRQHSSSSGKLPAPLRRHVQRQKPTNDSFRQAVDHSFQSTPQSEVGVDIDNGHMPQSSSFHHSLPRPDKERMKERRKSTGSGFFSKIGLRFGSSRSRDSSQEKHKDEANKENAQYQKYQKETERIQHEYEKLKRQQTENLRRAASPAQSSSPLPTAHLPPPSSHDSHQRPPPPVHPSARLPPAHATGAPPPPYHPPPTIHDNTNGGGNISYDMEDSNRPPWFSLAAEHQRYYRSLDRVAACQYTTHTDHGGAVWAKGWGVRPSNSADLSVEQRVSSNRNDNSNSVVGGGAGRRAAVPLATTHTTTTANAPPYPNSRPLPAVFSPTIAGTTAALNQHVPLILDDNPSTHTDDRIHNPHPSTDRGRSQTFNSTGGGRSPMPMDTNVVHQQQPPSAGLPRTNFQSNGDALLVHAAQTNGRAAGRPPDYNQVLRSSGGGAARTHHVIGNGNGLLSTGALASRKVRPASNYYDYGRQLPLSAGNLHSIKLNDYPPQYAELRRSGRLAVYDRTHTTNGVFSKQFASVQEEENSAYVLRM